MVLSRTAAGRGPASDKGRPEPIENAQGIPPPYTPTQRQADEDRRTTELVQRHADCSPEHETRAQREAEVVHGPGTPAADAAQRGTAGEERAQSGISPNRQIDGESAEDCVNTWRRAQEESMKDQCRRDRRNNEANANRRGHQAESDQLEHDANAARDEARAARAAANGNAEVRDPDDARFQDQPRLEREASAAEARAAAAERAALESRSQGCAAEQGNRLSAAASGEPGAAQVNGQIPAESRPVAQRGDGVPW